MRSGLTALTNSSPAADSPVEMHTTSPLSANTKYGVYAQQAVGLGSSFSILQLRMAEAVQKYREVSQFADQDARGQIMAHFGVSLSPVLSDKCIYLGGSSSNIDLSEVVNTNITGDNVAEIAGKGVGTGQGISADFYLDYDAMPDGKISVKEQLGYMIYATKVGMKTWYYLNSKVGAGQSLTDQLRKETHDAEQKVRQKYPLIAGHEEPVDPYCESCSL